MTAEVIGARTYMPPPSGGAVAGNRSTSESFVPLVLADPLGSLLPLLDPFREPCQVGAGSDEESRVQRFP
jgi:hypothetical protein